MGAPFKSTAIWTPFVERIEHRLMCWKRNSLSKGGRLVLIKSCLLSIPTYYLSLFPIPTKLALRMEKLVRGFLWGEKTAKKPFCLVNWTSCGQPKSRGGIGIRGFILMNRSLTSKWIWRFAKERSALWRQVIEQKHGQERGGIFPKVPRGSHGVGLWKFISQQASFIHANSSFELGNGKSIRFWLDRWCHSRTLKELAPHLFGIVRRKQSLVSEIVKQVNGQISIHLQFYASIDYEFMQEVVTVHNLVFAQTFDDTKEDVLLWDDDLDMGFSVSAAYDRMLPEVQIHEDFPFKNIWRKGVPLKCQFMAWSASLNRVATFDLLRRRRIIWVNHCSLCYKDQETANHIFIHCLFSREVWWSLLSSFGFSMALPESVLDLFTQWPSPDFSRKGVLIWRFIPHAILWAVWSERNCRCFEGIEANPSKVVLATKGLLRVLLVFCFGCV